MTTISQAWAQGRAARARKRRSMPILLALVAYASRKLPTWQRARTAVMQWGAAVSICWGLFTQASLLAGFIGVGVSLLVLEALGGERA